MEINWESITDKEYEKLKKEFLEFEKLKSIGQKDYQILSFTNKSSITYLYNEQDGKYGNIALLPYFLKRTHAYAINSVKRVSDGVVFNVGDIITSSTTNGARISAIYVEDGLLKIRHGYAEASSRPNGGFFTMQKKDNSFKTADGYKVEYGSTVHILNINTLRYNTNVCAKRDVPANYLYFKSEARLKSYIKYNTPSLSLREMFKMINDAPNPNALIKKMKITAKKNLNK